MPIVMNHPAIESVNRDLYELSFRSLRATGDLRGRPRLIEWYVYSLMTLPAVSILCL